jgi:hypothetical protein
MTTDLVMSDRQGVEIDYCPKCRGVWLDRGELDKIIERSADERPQHQAAAQQPQAQPPGEFRQPYRSKEYDSDDDYDDQRRPYKKRKSLLRELFDFD